MSYYQISHRGYPVAIVKTIDLARTITKCRRRGYYAIEKVENGEEIPSSTKLQQNTSAPKHLGKTTHVGKTTSRFARSRTTKVAAKAPARKPSKSR
jgi:hypothetical protein